MNNTQSFTYPITLSLFTTHEIDAINNHEWRVLPLTSWMTEDIGRNVFILSHIPLVYFIILLSSHKNDKIKSYTRNSIATFAIVHGFLHLYYSDNKYYEFSSSLSISLIVLTSLMGVIQLIEELKQKRTMTK
jgi:hypothetical protein